MAVYEQSTLLRCKDENGNEYLLYPITKLDCVDGAEDLVHYDKDQELTAVQKARFLKNIGGLCAPVSAQTNQYLKVSAVDEHGNVTAVETAEVEGGTGGSGGTVQPDWEQSDSTQADYIKNKPFGETMGIIDVLPSTQYDGFYLDSTYGVYSYVTGAIFELTIGKTYTVSWDGAEFVCVAQDASALMSGSVLLGNAINFGLSGNNEPFIIAAIKGVGVQYFSLTDTEEGGSHTISVATDGIVIEKIDSKYLTQPDWNENDATHASCIINRPFGEIPSGTVIVHETSVNLTQPFDELYGALIPSVGFIENHSYTVEFDGISYTLSASKSSDGSIMVVGEDDAVTTFVIIDNLGGSDITLVASTMGEHTFKIALAEDVITKIDAKYLPDNIGSGSSLPEVTTDDAGKFLRVSSEGTWVVETIQNVAEVGL